MESIIPTFTEEQQQIADKIITILEQLKKWEKECNESKEVIDNFVSTTLEKWVPLAEELGMSHEQALIQDLCVKIGFPEDYKNLKRLLQESEASCEMVFRTFALPLQAMLDDIGIEYKLKYRMKSIYSIWRKMRIDHKEFDDVYDLFAARIVYKPKPLVESLSDNNIVDNDPEAKAVKEWQLRNMDAEKFYCWRIYTVISSLYRMQSNRIKNWISNPKPSGYQALQMTVMGPDCNWIEIQVRSERMDYEAEHGMAAHWKYKKETKGM